MIIPWLFFLKEDEQMLIEGFTRRWTVNGPRSVTVPAFHRVTRRKGLTLGPTDYVRVHNTVTGELRNECGPKLYFPQESENEIKVKRIQGDIEAEKMKGQLLDIQREHVRTEALTEGEAEANRVKAFLDGLGDEISSEEKMALFNTLRKQEALKKLSEGSAQLYFTPDDVNLSIET